MIIYVTQQFENVATNNILVNGDVEFTLTSGFSRNPVVLPATILTQNDRYTMLNVDFNVDFKDQHKNGIYYYTISNSLTVFEKGYCKIVTEPGGQNGAITFDSGVETEERESIVYYRPNY